MDRARRVEPTGRGFFQAFSRVHCRPGAWFRGTLSGAGFSHSGATIGGTLPTSLTEELGSYLSRARKPWAIARAAGCCFDLPSCLGSLNPLLPRSLSLERSDFLAPVCVCNRKWFLPWPFSCARCRAWRCIASAHLCRVA